MSKVDLKQVNILIAIVTYNGEKFIESCIDSIQTVTKCQIHVIDNQSNDNTTSIIKNKYPHVFITESKENLGFGKANNLLLEKAIDAEMDFVFLLNQDAYFVGDCLDLLINEAINSDEYIFSPMHLKKDRCRLDEGFAMYTKDGLMLDNLSFVNAAAWLIPMRILKAVGGFNPLFFHYGEDRDYANRLKYKGFSFQVIKDAQLIHNRDLSHLKNLTVKKHQYEYRFYINTLRYFTDINNNMAKCLFNSIYMVVREIISNMYLKRWFLIRGNLNAIWKCCYQIRSIYQKRETAKKWPSAFLNVTLK